MSRSEEQANVPKLEDKWYKDWIDANLPDLSGRVAVVTGANSGIGFWAASALAGNRCEVVLACRSVAKAEAAKGDIVERHPDAKLSVIPLDNMDFSSVRAFAKEFESKYDRLDILLNNAGIMAQPLKRSRDGFDVQMQTNHLSHFLLTQLLWKKLVDTEGQSRVIQVSSGCHHMGRPKFDRDRLDNPTYSWGGGMLWYIVGPLMGMKPRDHWLRYGVSKLSNVLFMRELERKIKERGMEDMVISLSCHPGYASTQLQHYAGEAGAFSNFQDANRKYAQSAADGSLPLLMCCAGKDVKNGDYLGPGNSGEMTGPPKKLNTGGNSNSLEQAKALWEFSEDAVGAKFII